MNTQKQKATVIETMAFRKSQLVILNKIQRVLIKVR